MTQLIFGQDEALAKWAETQFLECAPLARPLTAIGIASSGGQKILGVAIFHNFRHNDVEVTFVTATPRWATSGNIRAILHYPFAQLGVARMTAITAKTNKRARKLLEGLGFKLEGTHPFARENGGAACTYGLYKKTVFDRWLNG